MALSNFFLFDLLIILAGLPVFVIACAEQFMTPIGYYNGQLSFCGTLDPAKNLISIEETLLANKSTSLRSAKLSELQAQAAQLICTHSALVIYNPYEPNRFNLLTITLADNIGVLASSQQNTHWTNINLSVESQFNIDFLAQPSHDYRCFLSINKTSSIVKLSYCGDTTSWIEYFCGKKLVVSDEVASQALKQDASS